MSKDTSNTESKTRAVKAKENKARPKRVPMSAGAKLVIPEGLVDRKKFYPRFIADDPGRLAQAELARYEYVVDEKGNKVIRNGVVDLYLMKLPMEYREEDLKLKAKRVSDSMIETQKMGKDEYLPEGKKAALEREDLDPLA